MPSTKSTFAVSLTHDRKQRADRWAVHSASPAWRAGCTAVSEHQGSSRASARELRSFRCRSSGHHIFGSWIYDYVLAFAFGILFQYLTIKPMRRLSRKEGLEAAIKADALSLTAWQVGMYGWMAIATFAIFGREIPKSSPVFWFMMQIGMVLGFFTSYPVNWLLIRRGVKERM